MSVRVMTRVWELDLPDSQKIVLLALADCANDEGHCWPSMRTLAAKCSKGERTVQGVIIKLCEAGHLTRREVPGKGCNYTVHPRSDSTPAENAPRREVQKPPQGLRDTPAAAADKPSKNHNKPSTPRKREGGKTIIPEDWKAPAVADLPPQARACAEQWTAASYRTHAEAFHNYWRSARRMYADWNLTWANRIVALHSQVMRDQKFGNAPTDIPKPAKQITPEGRELLRAYQAGEITMQEFNRRRDDLSRKAA